MESKIFKGGDGHSYVVEERHDITSGGTEPKEIRVVTFEDLIALIPNVTLQSKRPLQEAAVSKVNEVGIMG